MFRFFHAVALLTLFAFCSSKVNILKDRFEQSSVPPSPDYSRPECWASLPTKVDAADSIPIDSNLKNLQSSALADVFFIYPTVFVGKPTNQFQWNADVNDSILNHKIQITTILNQASIFNEACRIYSPYYRQAHLYAFYTLNKEDGDSALNLAYRDVKAAFEYYLKYFNHGRPIIIASHSQGSYHGERLLRDYFDGKELFKKLVVAYLIGRPIKPDAFLNIQPTKNPEEIGVWISWNTFGRNFIPYDYSRFKGALCTNPLLWNSSDVLATKDLNKGSVALKFTFKPHLVDAQNHLGLLWISRPKLQGSLWVSNKSWHRADMNFFYMNIRENVAMRIKTYLEKEKLFTSLP